MLRGLKKVICMMLIIILLPYVITIFANGVDIKSEAQANHSYIIVETDSGSMEVDIDEYAIGVLASQLPDNYEKEAVKAQAVIVRSTIYKKLNEDGDQAVFTDSFWTTKDMQRQWGASGYSEKYQELKDAWTVTDGEVVMYEDEIAMTPFHQLSNGQTRDGNEAFNSDAYPYLVSKECPEDIEATDQMQTASINWMDCEVESLDSAGYVLSVRCGSEIISGEDFRRTYVLISSCFTIQDQEDELRITTQGIGHGLGLSQNTANIMAKEGNTYREILLFFFEDTEIKEVSEIL